MVPIVHDRLSEHNEQFRANLLLVDNNGINVSVYPEQSTVVIINDDSKWKEKVREKESEMKFLFLLNTEVFIGFAEDSVTVNEPMLVMSLTVRILSGLLVQGTSALVGFSTSDGSTQCKYTNKIYDSGIVQMHVFSWHITESSMVVCY